MILRIKGDLKIILMIDLVDLESRIMAMIIDMLILMCMSEEIGLMSKLREGKDGLEIFLAK